MDFYAVVEQVLVLLRSRGRVPYRVLKLQLQLDDEAIEALKDELIHAQQVAADEDGRVLVWTGGGGRTPAPTPSPSGAFDRQADLMADVTRRSAEARMPEAERRQLTVLFCDLVDSTVLASRLDPEEWREVVRAYQEACAKVIARFEGHIAQYLGDGLLVYFGYPRAHEDDAQRAVRAGLAMVEAMGSLNRRLQREQGIRLAVRVGIHTGLVVVGEMGGGGRQEQLALGDTPNLAARLQGLAAPDTVVISAATRQLIQGYFTCQALGSQTLKGVATPLQVYQVGGATAVQQRFEIAAARGLTPLVGREPEVGLLRERWAQVKDGLGQVVVLSGEAGIGKSRLVQVVKDEIIGAAALRIECRCSPYHQHSALYPVIAHLERALAFHRDETPEDRLRKLEAALQPSPLPLVEVLPLVAALLSVPLPASSPLLTLTPQRQRQKTLEALLSWLLALTAQQPVLVVMEDLHWIDPSTLEFLTLLVDQGPTARLLTLLTCRPEFQVPWGGRTYLTPIALQRLPQPQVEAMIARLTAGKALPPEVVAQLVAKTDGVPLFVEELTKTVLESGLLQETQGHYALTGPLPALAIPATLHDSLMARLDRLATAKDIAQLGATIGRAFPYDLLSAVAPWDGATLQQGLARLVEAELLYQRGVLPRATYHFKHALVQDAASQSLLKRTRQQYHRQIAHVLAEQFPETAETQPELLAYHYTEAGLSAQAIPYWQRAGQRAIERSAHVEAVAHLTKGLKVLQTLPDTPERAQQELVLQTTLGPALMATKGFASPDVERTYARARELCRHMVDIPQVFPVLWGLWLFYEVRGALQTARELAAQLLALAQRQQEPLLLLQAHRSMGQTLLWLGELISARAYLEEGIALHDAQQHRALAFHYGPDPGVGLRNFAAHVLWYLGYPDQALKTMDEALSRARELSHPFSLAPTLDHSAWLHQYRREGQLTQGRAEADMALSREHGFAFFLAQGTIMRGWGLAEQGQVTQGMAEIHAGLAAIQATGAELTRPYWLALLAEACGKTGQVEEGLRLLTEALAAAQTHGSHVWDAELHRLTGELLLRQAVSNPEEAERRFQESLAIARRQEAKSLELRAAMSLARLWLQQGKRSDAHALLAPIYGWFTEGFDTADLQEGKALLETLTSRDAGGHARSPLP
jgi:class 3 adenylate cyclase/predicted ATPase